MKKSLFFWRELMVTFWFLPVLIIFFSILLSIGLVYLDNQVTISNEGWFRFFLVQSSDSARSILTTISSAMINVAGTVFSVTLVALTLASSQLGPRLISNFMYVRLNQIVLGSYVSTYLYCLIVLNSVSDSNDYVFIPSLSILAAILAAIVNIILLIIFIHRIATSIQADKVVSDISKFISKQVETHFPEKDQDETEDEEREQASEAISGYQNQTTLESPESGYLQYIDIEALLKVVARQDALVELYHRPGSYLVKGGQIGLLYSNANWEKDELKKVSNQLVIGETKTSQQDIEYSIGQMVEIAARALSTGVNDPYTAIACIDNLSSIMSYLAQAKFPSKYKFDEDEKLRVIIDTTHFEGALDAAFNQIRQFSGGSPAVIIRLMEALITIHKFTTKESHREAVIRHAGMVLSTGRNTIEDKNDIDDLNQRAGKLLNTGSTTSHNV